MLRYSASLLLLWCLAPIAAMAQPPAPSSAGNLSALAKALQAYHERHGLYPAAFRTSADGKPLLSWRVAILPHLGEEKLYVEFHLDEAWDSEHNKRLVAKMPRVFRSPLSTADAGLTTYFGNGGATGVIARPPVEMRQIIDGTAATLAIVEVGDKAAVPWTKPIEWVFVAPTSLKDFADLPGTDVLAALCEGSVVRIPKATPPVMWRRLFNREEGEPLHGSFTRVEP